MVKKSVWIIGGLLLLTSCSVDKSADVSNTNITDSSIADSSEVAPLQKQSTAKPDSKNQSTDREDSSKFVIYINEQEFTASFADNETAMAFKRRLPLTLSMNELNGNEKFFDLDESLPSNSQNIGTIENGDLMLYGSRTIVLFYKQFDTSYSYTRIGKVDNPSNFEMALGRGDVTVTFAMVN